MNVVQNTTLASKNRKGKEENKNSRNQPRGIKPSENQRQQSKTTTSAHAFVIYKRKETEGHFVDQNHVQKEVKSTIKGRQQNCRGNLAIQRPRQRYYHVSALCKSLNHHEKKSTSKIKRIWSSRHFVMIGGKKSQPNQWVAVPVSTRGNGR